MGEQLNERLRTTRQANKVLIAAHRGTWGGNIIQNTIPAYEMALMNGAQIIEVDVVRSTDGEFFAFHTGQEPGLLRTDRSLKTMSSTEIENCQLRNCTQDVVKEKINRLDDILEHFKGRCLINIDRSWWFWEDTLEILKRHNMQDQILLKSAPEVKLLSILSAVAPELMYMPIIRRPEQLETVERFTGNTVGAELIFENEDNPLLTEPCFARMKSRGMLLWANALTLNDTTKLAAGHDDDTSLLKGADAGWGWLIEKGFDMIQTDWPWMLRQYVHTHY